MWVARIKTVAEACGQTRASAMFGSGDHIKPHRFWNLNVSLSERISVQKRRALLPILRRSIDLHDQRIEAAVAQQRAALSRDRIGEVGVGEGKMILWEVVVFMLRVSAIGLAKLHVGKNSADAGDVDEQGVENFAPVFILIKTEIDVIAQIAAALRETVGVGGFDRRRLAADR